MTNKRLYSYILEPILLLTSFIFFGTVALSWVYHEKNLFEISKSEIKKQTKTLLKILSPLKNKELSPSKKEILNQFSKTSGYFISLYTSDSTPLYSSNPDAFLAITDPYEIKKVLNGYSEEYSLRFDETYDSNILFLAMPIALQEEEKGALQLGVPLNRFHNVAPFPLGILAILFIFFSIINMLFIKLINNRNTKFLSELEMGLKSLKSGNFNQWIIPSKILEHRNIVKTTNQMLTELEKRFNSVINQKLQSETILSSMKEGVIALDEKEKFLTINNSALNLFNIKRKNVTGKLLFQVIRNPTLNEQIARVYSEKKLQESILTLIEEPPVYIHVTTAPWKNEGDIVKGTVSVFSDITQIKNLENLRKEFVANVSHELKTPITSIQGFVETLIDGAIDNKEDALRFLNIIAKQSERLTKIIEDLLSLSRIEQGKDNIDFQLCNVQSIIRAAIEICQQQAYKKNIKISLNYSEDTLLNVNAALLEQAIINLIDNAIKYSLENTCVVIECEIKNDYCSISIIDQGRGISREHQSRLFERFYRIDKARSRKLGGTGLGLSIVKHIAKIHRGSVSVSSEIDQGSTFTIKLPIN